MDRTFRAIPDALADDEEFQALSPTAKAAWLVLRLKLGQYGINAFYPEILPRLVRATQSDVESALSELELPRRDREYGWLAREGNLFWLVDALVDDPGFRNANHREGARKFLENLPQVPLLERFRNSYRIPPRNEAETADMASKSSSDAIHQSISKALPGGMGYPTAKRTRSVSDGFPISESDNHSETDTDIQIESELESESVFGVEIGGDLRRVANRFLARFYGNASEDRKSEVVAQLRSSLFDKRGARVKRGVYGKARDEKQLAKSLQSVLEDPPRKSDAALYVVLLKLGDCELDAHGHTITEAASIRARATENIEMLYAQERRDNVLRWTQANPAEAEEITRRVQQSVSCKSDDPGWQVEYDARWTQAFANAAGVPAFEDWCKASGHLQTAGRTRGAR